MSKFLIDLTTCFSKGEVLTHGGGEYGKEAALFFAENLIGYEVLALIQSDVQHIASNELGSKIQLRKVGNGPMRQLPVDLDSSDNTLFLPLGAPFLESNGSKAKTRFIVVENGFRYLEKTYSITDHLCHPLLNEGIWNSLLHCYARYLRRKRLRHGISRIKCRFEALKEKDLVITPSRHTKYTFLLHSDVFAPEKMDKLSKNLFMLPPLSPFTSEARNDKKHRKGILLLSTNRAMKNAAGLLSGIARHEACLKLANQQGIDLLGTDASSRKLLDNRFGHTLNLRYHPYVEYNYLQDFIRHAQVLVFPSISEGYGIPPVQAFKYGTPVLASATTSIPEVVGGAAMLADPLQPTEMANRLLQLLDDPELWHSLSKNGRRRYETLKRQTCASWHNFVCKLNRQS